MIHKNSCATEIERNQGDSINEQTIRQNWIYFSVILNFKRKYKPQNITHLLSELKPPMIMVRIVLSCRNFFFSGRELYQGVMLVSSPSEIDTCA